MVRHKHGSLMGLPETLAVFITILVMAWLLIPNRKHQQPDELGFTANSQEYQESIERGLDYINQNSEKVAAFQWLILDYLQRRFDLDPQFSATKRNLKTPASQQEALELKVHRRIAFPDEIADSLPLEGASHMQRMVTMATNCDRVKLPPDFQQLIDRNVNAGGYSVTHAAYSLERMKENGCLLPKEVDRRIRLRVARKMVELINSKATSPDLRYEAIALLMHMGRRDLVKQEWLVQTLREQQPDGGWKQLATNEESSDHTTVLALWALLELSRPNVADEPVIHRPRLKSLPVSN